MNELDVETYVNNVLKIETKRTSSDELVSLCPHPRHNDRTPSWYINRHTGLHQCKSCGFKGNIEVLTNVILGRETGTKVLRHCLGIDGNEDEWLRNKITQLRTESAPQESPFQYSSFLHYTDNFERETHIDEHLMSKIKVYFTAPLIQEYNIRHWTLPGFYCNRLVIPLVDFHGDIVNMNFRRVDESMPNKYCTLPIKAAKKKTNELLFLNTITRHSLPSLSTKKLPYLVITEGCFDAIKLGVDGIFAASIFSNEVSFDQIALINQITEFTIILLDSDKMGIHGSWKTFHQMRKYLNCVNISEQFTECDPDEIRKEELMEVIEAEVKRYHEL